MTDSKKPDYEVGYSRPPKANQFRKGQSGNPSGTRRSRKPKLRSTLRDLAIEEASELVQINLNGRQTKISKKEALVKGLMNDALTGTAAHRLKCARILMDIGAFDVPYDTRGNDAAARKKFLEQLAKEAESHE